MQTFLLLLSLTSSLSWAQLSSSVPAQPEALPQSAPLQSVNTNNLQINNNVRTTLPTPVYTATPTFQPQQPLQQEQQVLPYYGPNPTQ